MHKYLQWSASELCCLTAVCSPREDWFCALGRRLVLCSQEKIGSVLSGEDWFCAFKTHLVLLLWCLSESSKEEFASTSIADELVRLFQKQTEHEKKEMIFEVLAPLAENGNMIVLVWGENNTTKQSGCFFFNLVTTSGPSSHSTFIIIFIILKTFRHQSKRHIFF